MSTPSRKPIAVIQNVASVPAGHFADFMAAHAQPLRHFHPYAGDDLPRGTAEFAGLCVLGGTMSVNDDLPFLRATEALIRDAISRDVPVIGHCLGGQLLANATGGRVRVAAQREIGWIDIDTVADTPAQEWFGARAFKLFHWHGDTFDVPPGGTLLATSASCRNQVFALGKLHLGMQFHCEITAPIIDDWVRTGHAEMATHPAASVHSPERIFADTPAALPASQSTADRIYTRWMRHLQP